MKMIYKNGWLFAGIFGAVAGLCGCATHEKIANPTPPPTSIGCQYHGVMYSDGAVVGREGTIYRCTAGQWLSTGKTCEPDVTILFQGDALVGNSVVSVAPGQYPAVISAYQARYIVVSRVSDIAFGIKNTSSQCLVAVYVWTGPEGQPIIRHYMVPAGMQINVHQEGHSGRIIAEVPCPTAHQ